MFVYVEMWEGTEPWQAKRRPCSKRKHDHMHQESPVLATLFRFIIVQTWDLPRRLDLMPADRSILLPW